MRWLVLSVDNFLLCVLFKINVIVVKSGRAFKESGTSVCTHALCHGQTVANALLYMYNIIVNVYVLIWNVN